MYMTKVTTTGERIENQMEMQREVLQIISATPEWAHAVKITEQLRKAEGTKSN